MTESSIKSIIKKYKLRINILLFMFLMFFIAANWFLINSSIEKHYSLGLTYTSADTGFIWSAIIMGLMIVLNLCVYLIENVLIDIFKQQNEKAV